MTSEISEHMTKNDARLITGYIRNLIASVTEKIDEIGKMLTKAYDRRAWVALGYESWDAYVSAELRTDRLRLDRDDRQDLVVQLRSAGMATRAIGAAVGADDKTVRNDLRGAEFSAPESVTGTDGKTYPSSPPVRDEPLLHGEGERRTVPAGSDTPRAQELPDETPVTRPVEDQGAPAPSVTPTDEQISDAVSAGSADYRNAVYRKNLTRQIAAVQSLTVHEPERVVEIADELTFEVIDNAAESIALWHERIAKLRRRPLRVVEGGRG